MAFKFIVEVEGDTAVRAAFSRFGELTKDLRPAWNMILEDFYDTETNLFNSQGASGGKGWAPLAPSTLRRKKGPSILVETGDLKRSLTQKGGANVAVMQPMMARFGTKDKKAPFHFYGTATMPRREPILLTGVDTKRWTKLVQRYFVGIARDSGLLSYKMGG
jgi:phage gpG-like protein